MKWGERNEERSSERKTKKDKERGRSKEMGKKDTESVRKGGVE
jgi:hypothetical protein